MHYSARRSPALARLLAALGLLLAGAAAGAGPGAATTPRLPDGHPDLNGNWIGPTGAGSTIAYPRGAAPEGSINAGMMSPEVAARALKLMQETGTGQAAASFGPDRNPPAYKTDALRQKAAQLWQDGSRTDAVVLCGQPGVPRVGGPSKIVQTAREVVFLYADPSGMVWRIVPTDGRDYRKHLDPSFYGDAVGHWEGDTLVVETRNFNDETWFGEYGYFHGERMRVVERLTRLGDTLTWQATVEDPDVLAAPWVKPPVEMHLTDRQLEEPDRCVASPVDAGHHEERVP
jgi:hypothetical protein